MSATSQDGFAGTANATLESRQMTNIASPYAANGGTWAKVIGPVGRSLELVGSTTDGWAYNPAVAIYDDQYYGAQVTPTGYDYYAQGVVNILKTSGSGGGYQFGGVGCRLWFDGASLADGLVWGYNTGTLAWELWSIYGGTINTQRPQKSVLYSYAAAHVPGDTPACKIVVSGWNPGTVTLYIGSDLNHLTQVESFAFWSTSHLGEPGIALSVPLTASGTVDSSASIEIGQFSSGDQGSQAAVSVKIIPATLTLLANQKFTFTAQVNNTSNTAVTWSTDGGTVSSTGLYTAPNTPGTYHVTATSVADNTKSATATVTVLAANPYILPGTTITELSTQAQNLQAWTHRQNAEHQEVQSELWYWDTSQLATPTGLAAVLAAGGTLAVGTTRYYKVTATNAASGVAIGETLASVEVSATPTTGNQTIALTWNAVPGATGYNVYCWTASGGEKLIKSVGGTSYNDTGADAIGTQTPPTSNTTARWFLFPIQPNQAPQQEENQVVLTRAFLQPSTLSCSFIDHFGKLTPQNKGSSYNQNQTGAYDALMDVQRKVLWRVGQTCYPNAAAGLTPTSSLAPAAGALSLLSDGAWGDVTVGSSGYVQWQPANSNPFTLTYDLGSAMRVYHVALRLATLVGTCTFPASIKVSVSTDNVNWTDFKSARPIGGTGGDWDDDYGGLTIPFAWTGLRDLGLVRWVRFTITPTGSQTIWMDEAAVYADNGTGRVILGNNRFVGYLGRQGGINSEGHPSFVAVDALKKLQDNNENELTAQFTMQDVADIAYTLATSAAYWRGTGTNYSTPFAATEMGWQSGVNVTGQVLPVWQGHAKNQLGYLMEILHEIGWYLYADGNGVLQIAEPPYTQRLPDRVLIADADGNQDVRACVRSETDSELRNVWEVDSGSAKQGGGSTILFDPGSVAKFGWLRSRITDPLANSGDILNKIAASCVRDYAWRRWMLTTQVFPEFEQRPRKIYGFRTSERVFLHPKANGASWDKELWALDTSKERFTHGMWVSDNAYIPYVPAGSVPPINLSLSQTNTTLTLSWAASTDTKVTGYRCYISSSPHCSNTMGLPELGLDTFTNDGGTIAGTSHTFSNLTQGSQYWVYVTAVNVDGTESLPSVILTGIPGTTTGNFNDWSITDLSSTFNQVQGPQNGLGYYTYETLLKFHAPPWPNSPSPDNGQGGLKRMDVYFVLDNLPSDPSNKALWTWQDEWHAGDRVKPGYMQIGSPAANQTPGPCTWYGRFRSASSLSGHKVYWRIWTSSDAHGAGNFASNIPPAVTLS